MCTNSVRHLLIIRYCLILTVYHVPERRHRDVFPAQIHRASFATQACCNRWSSFLLGTSSMTSLFIKNFWFAQTAVEKIQQIPDCCVRVGEHSGCCAESCTKLLLLDFFCQRFVDSFWECLSFICLSLLPSSLVFVVPLFCIGSSFPRENQTMPLRLCSLYACVVIGTSLS